MNKTGMREILTEGLNRLHVPYTGIMLEQLEQYAALLLRWNEKMNLTAITQPEEVAVKHFLDCAACLSCVHIAGGVIDVGTGAGFPGLVWKILKPELSVTLLDSLNKRLIFLQEVIDTLGLKNVQIIHARAEDGGRDQGLRGQFDVVTARAVANLNTLSEYCLPFAKIGGMFLAMKGPEAEGEVESARGAVGKLGGEIQKIDYILLPGTDITHSVIQIKKLRQTPTAYPRKAGKPAKEPLK